MPRSPTASRPSGRTARPRPSGPSWRYEDRELTRVEDLARAAGVGIRTLQRGFTEHVGIGPKWFLRRYRLYEAGEQIAHNEQVDWSALATDLGYADQSHLTRDFTAAFGVPPAQYAAAVRKR